MTGPWSLGHVVRTAGVVLAILFVLGVAGATPYLVPLLVATFVLSVGITLTVSTTLGELRSVGIGFPEAPAPRGRAAFRNWRTWWHVVVALLVVAYVAGLLGVAVPLLSLSTSVAVVVFLALGLLWFLRRVLAATGLLLEA